ncbi:MAG: hypothetical protein ACOX6T_04665 [Myxococcales bacterium]|jgi:hypothetical protein
MWLYSRLPAGYELDLRRAIEEQTLPLREVFGRRLGEERYEWGNPNPDPLNLRGPSQKGKRWKPCHLYSVSDGLPDELEWQKKRFFRLMHPFNMFLFPRPIRKGAGYPGSSKQPPGYYFAD